MTRTIKLLGVAAFAAASTLSLGSAATADVEADGWEFVHDYDAEDDGDDGGVSLEEEAHTSKSSVWGSFWAYGEHLEIQDHFNNDRPTVARLWVGGSGPAVFYTKGKSESFNLSYDEGQTVYLEVCTSDSPNAVCTEKVKHPGVT